jgi:methylated-DNA-[protein]-cysteine S-methyltransferase
MLGGATEAGICLCEFADRGGKERIIGRLEKRHGREVVFSSPPGAGQDADAEGTPPQDAHLDDLVDQLREYFRRDRREFELALELGGTPWQRTVWAALLEIPYGSTVSYGRLASQLGKPGGSQAVGRANGDNYVAIVVPCHRVVQADGGLRGYGGGLHRKRWLLDLEAGVLQLPL